MAQRSHMTVPDSHPGPLDVPPIGQAHVSGPLRWLFLQPLCSAPVPAILLDVCLNASIRPSPPSNTLTPLTKSCLSPPLCHLRKLTYCDRLGEPLLRAAEQLQAEALQGPAPR